MPKSFKRFEHVLEQKKIHGLKMVLVKWLDYLDKFNQWIAELVFEDISAD
jgi:hypothetical protein